MVDLSLLTSWVNSQPGPPDLRRAYGGAMSLPVGDLDLLLAYGGDRDCACALAAPRIGAIERGIAQPQIGFAAVASGLIDLCRLPPGDLREVPQRVRRLLEQDSLMAAGYTGAQIEALRQAHTAIGTTHDLLKNPWEVTRGLLCALVESQQHDADRTTAASASPRHRVTETAILTIANVGVKLSIALGAGRTGDPLDELQGVVLEGQPSRASALARHRHRRAHLGRTGSPHRGAPERHALRWPLLPIVARHLLEWRLMMTPEHRS